MEVKTGTEKESVNNNMTPVAKKTRLATRLKSCEEDLQPRTPKATSTATITSETPRRSARKSIRPSKDYKDIIENSVMRSARKVNNTINAVDEEDQEREVEVEEIQKWQAAEVGRASRKRGRKSKRGTSKMPKMQPEEGGDEHNETHKEEMENEVNEKVMHKTATVHTAEETLTDPKAGLKKEASTVSETEETVTASVETAQVTNVPEVPAELETVLTEEAATKDASVHEVDLTFEETDNLDIVPAGTASAKATLIATSVEEETSTVSTEDGRAIAANVPTGAATHSIAKAVSIEGLDQSLDTEILTKHVTADDMDDLGLSPLAKQANPTTSDEDDDVDNEEMPSLIVLDDEDPVEELNQTFEIDESPEKQAHSQFLDIEMPTLQMSPELGIKVVLTDENDENTTLLKTSNTPKSSKSKAYKFPTPFKSTSKLNLKFTGVMKSSCKKKIMNAGACRTSRRSKSVSDLTQDQGKTVSFYSPIEVSTVSDIDKRWEGLNVSHVTQRRKRSKSLDAPIVKSKIPKPKFYGVTKAPSPLPLKVKQRTKLPNFAAIHQKHFSKMENLVDHIERKAVRAKELTTSSAKKLIPGNNTNSAKKLAPNSATKVQKKIALVMTPMKPQEANRKRNLPTPRNIIAAQPQPAMTSSRLPLLTKPAVTKPKIITATTTTTTTNVAMAASAIVQNKLEARRKRHMEMFMGRTTKENRSDLIRGVRSNRRFELQMEHRRQMNENKS